MLINVYVYVKAALAVITIRRWVKRVNGYPREKGETELCNRSRSGRSVAVVNEDKTKQTGVFITSDYNFIR